MNSPLNHKEKMMKNRFIIFSILATVFLFTAAKADSNKESDYQHAFNLADGIRAAVWDLNSENDPVAQKLDECQATHTDTMGMEKCLDDAYASYKNILKALEKNVGARSECRGTICGILSRNNDIGKIRERIAETSLSHGGGQE
jgi:hypothetical protein